MYIKVPVGRILTYVQISVDSINEDVTQDDRQFCEIFKKAGNQNRHEWQLHHSSP